MHLKSEIERIEKEIEAGRAQLKFVSSSLDYHLKIGENVTWPWHTLSFLAVI